MKRIWIYLAFLVLCVCCFAGTVPVRATEICADDVIDFDNVNWDSIEWNLETEEQLDRWIEEQQDLNKLFSVYFNIPASCYTYNDTLMSRLLEDPVSFLRALAKEERSLQETIAQSMTLHAYYMDDADDRFPAAIASVTLTQEDNTQTRELLSFFESCIHENWGDTNPKTADPIGLVVTILALSGTAGAVLIKKKVIL